MCQLGVVKSSTPEYENFLKSWKGIISVKLNPKMDRRL
jgi:hypothetical protein